MTSLWSLRPAMVWCGLLALTFVEQLAFCKTTSQCATSQMSKYAVAFLGGHAGWMSHSDLSEQKEAMNSPLLDSGQCLRVRGRQRDRSNDQVTLSYKEVKDGGNGRTSNGSKDGATKRRRKFKGSKSKRKKEKKKRRKKMRRQKN